MKRDLLIAGVLVALACVGIGVVVLLPNLQKDDERPKTIKPKPEPIVLKKEETKRPVAPIKVAAVKEKKGVPEIEKKIEPEPKRIEEKKPIAKLEPEPKKIESKKEYNKGDTTKVIEFDPLYRLNDLDGEYTVKPLSRGKEIKVIGKIKTLKISGLNERSAIDTTELEAQAIIFLGNINGGSKAILGRTQTLRIRDINDQALLDASASDAREVVLEGSVNSQSVVKLSAVKGTVEIFGEINDRSQIEIAVPEGKVLFKSRGDSVINGSARVKVVARDVEFRGAINGEQTDINVTLSKDGSLKFTRMNGGVRMNYRKANPGDAEPRIEKGQVDARAQFRFVK